jgi:hypothetical protein
MNPKPSVQPVPQSRDDLNRRNLRMALILASIALAVFLGFVAKYVILSK